MDGDNKKKVIEGETIESSNKAQEFATKYQALCKETGYQIVITPAYIKRDDNSYSTIIQTSVGEMPKDK